MVRLGAGGLDGRSLTPTAMAAALQTLSKFKRLAESHKVDEIIAAATSATREADNGGDFIAEVDRQTGIQIRVISGHRRSAADPSGRRLRRRRGRHRPPASIDIGGGSVEVTLGTATQLTLGTKLQDRRHPADRALRQERPARRGATSAGW